MSSAPEAVVRLAGADDLASVGRLLDDFNREYDEPTPGPEQIATRLRELSPAATRSCCSSAPDPTASRCCAFVRRSGAAGSSATSPSCTSCPTLRGQGLGRALLDAAIALARERGADHMDLGTSEDDVAARALYESAGFTNRERPPDGPVMYVYERSLEAGPGERSVRSPAAGSASSASRAVTTSWPAAALAG